MLVNKKKKKVLSYVNQTHLRFFLKNLQLEVLKSEK